MTVAFSPSTVTGSAALTKPIDFVPTLAEYCKAAAPERLRHIEWQSSSDPHYFFAGRGFRQLQSAALQERR